MKVTSGCQGDMIFSKRGGPMLMYKIGALFGAVEIKNFAKGEV